MMLKSLGLFVLIVKLDLNKIFKQFLFIIHKSVTYCLSTSAVDFQRKRHDSLSLVKPLKKYC